jgi:hypothetical protein
VIEDIIDLTRYPLDRPGSLDWTKLVDSCRADLSAGGMFSLEGFVRQEALQRALAEIVPQLESSAFTHSRLHNIYFKKSLPGLSPDHPALRQTETINHTLCADQIAESLLLWIYEWSPFITFLAATMNKSALYPMRDPLARVNVMAYREGEALNWHFDRSEFTTTILLQEPDEGGEFVYRSNLRSDDDPNYEGVAKLLSGEDSEVRTLRLSAGTLNVFRGKNTAHRVNPAKGPRPRIVTVFSYFDRPGVMFSPEERLDFYGRTS